MLFRSFRLTAVLMTCLFAVLLLNTAAVPTCSAGETGVLKLKVRPCYSTNWLSDAVVDVSIYRPGAGEVDSASGSTDSEGYVEFTFYDLIDADQARITVTPNDMGPDDGHTFYWIAGRGRSPGCWDLGLMGDSVCQDAWFDQTNRIFLCMYH